MLKVVDDLQLPEHSATVGHTAHGTSNQAPNNESIGIVQPSNSENDSQLSTVSYHDNNCTDSVEHSHSHDNDSETSQSKDEKSQGEIKVSNINFNDIKEEISIQDKESPPNSPLFIKQIAFMIAKNNFIVQFNLIMELTLSPTFQTNERKI